jgi:hypothetical protein
MSINKRFQQDHRRLYTIGGYRVITRKYRISVIIRLSQNIHIPRMRDEENHI